MDVYTIAKVGRTREVTPDGFLFIRDVAIARAGDMLYAPFELRARRGQPEIIANTPEGLVRVTRTDDEVFRPESLASINGKPLIDEHLSDGSAGVSPENWNALSLGVILNPRRGTGDFANHVVCDLLVTSKLGINLIDAGKVQVSCGYDCEYVQDAEANVFQRDIIYNHVALVEAGRCGTSCAVGDKQVSTGELTMAIDKKTFIEKVKAAFKGKDEACLAKTLDEMPDEFKKEEGKGKDGEAEEKKEPKWNDAALDAKFGEIAAGTTALKTSMDANHKAVMDSLDEFKKGAEKKEEPKAEDKEIEGELKEEAPPGAGEDAAKAKDSAFFVDSFQEALSGAEIIAPGIKLPTFDRALDPRKTLLSLCKLRAYALTLGNNDAATNGMIMQANGGRELTADSLAKMPCAQTRTLFNAVVGMKKAANAAADSKARTAEVTPINIGTMAGINKRNKDFWNERKKSIQ